MGTRFLGIVTFILSVISCIYCKNSYIIMVPQTLRPNLTTSVHVNILNATGPVQVTATLLGSNNETISSKKGPFLKGEPGFLKMDMPSDLHNADYSLKVIGSGGLTFTNYTKLKYNKKSSSIFIQTDKAIYKPGQTIKFRAFGIYPNMQVVKKPLTVEIFDPKKNKINQWKKKQEASGVFINEMVMSDFPVLGDWKIKVKQGKESAEKTFTVAEYVLPKFEVKVELPPFALTTRTFFNFKVTARYTFGKPVKGTGICRIKRKYPMLWLRTRDNYKPDLEEPFEIDGEYKFEVPIKELKKLDNNLAWSAFIVECNVTESVTGRRMNGSDEVTFYDTENKIEFAKSMPNNYKPGLIYTTIIKVTLKDGTPIPNPSKRVVISGRYYEANPPEPTTPEPPFEEEVPGRRRFRQKMIMPFRGPFGRRQERERKIKPVLFDVPVDGIISYNLDIPENATSVNLEAKYMEETAYKHLEPSKSPSNNFIQVKSLTKEPKAQKTALFEIKATESPEEVIYQILSKGKVEDSGIVKMTGNKTKTFKVPLTSEMAPKARMLIHYIRPDGEIVADSITFNIEGTFKNKVSMKFDQRKAQPGKEVLIEMKADPNSAINILALDKSVLLLKSGNDLSTDQITQELEKYDTVGGGGGGFPFWSWRFPTPNGGQDAADVFSNNGMAVMTDANLYNYERPFYPMIMDAVPMMAMAAPAPVAFAESAVQRSTSAQMAGSDELKPVERTRKLFPETWIWSNTTIGQDGTVTMSMTVPDTITSWVATAFAVSPESGLGISPSPANLRVFMPFFVSLNLPYSVVRGEMVILQANVFNYLGYTTWVLVILESSPMMNNTISYSNGRRLRYQTRVGRWLKVKNGEVKTAFFPITPIEAGEIPIQVSALSYSKSDAVERKLLVEPEGSEEFYNIPLLIDIKNGGTFEKTENITFPDDVIRGSKRVRVSTIGDVMGPTINGLDKLLKMPYGCGEQNMLNFAPNIFVSKYLDITESLQQDVREKSLKYMVKGYQREMTYQHSDGSFSAFGDSDKSGSMWLTAFVVKSFAQASPIITIDEGAVVKAIDWMVLYQNPNGSFREPGRVLHKAMQGGSASGERALTAFVLIAMIEAHIIPQTNISTFVPIQNAKRFLEQEVQSFTDVYELAIIAYALKLANSSLAAGVLERLESLATIEDGMKYWQRPQDKFPADLWRSWKPPHEQSNAINIELTAYVLLTYSLNKDKQNGVAVLKWLTTQRNHDGGFISTQDTVIALQALAEFAALIHSPDFNMKIRIEAKDVNFAVEYRITPENALILNSTNVPSNVKEITVSAQGKGVSLVDISVYFNVESDLMGAAFDINSTVSDESMNGFQLDVCTRWLRQRTSGMAIVEIGIPSGMTPDVPSLNQTRAPELKRKEINFRKLSLYFDEIGDEPQCISIYMEREDLVAEQQPSIIKAYDYYEPKLQKTEFYTSKLLTNSEMCDVCGEDCYCRKPLFRNRK